MVKKQIHDVHAIFIHYCKCSFLGIQGSCDNLMFHLMFMKFSFTCKCSFLGMQWSLWQSDVSKCPQPQSQPQKTLGGPDLAFPPVAETPCHGFKRTVWCQACRLRICFKRTVWCQACRLRICFKRTVWCQACRLRIPRLVLRRRMLLKETSKKKFSNEIACRVN